MKILGTLAAVAAAILVTLYVAAHGGVGVVACQPVQHNHRKMCRVYTPAHRVVFIRWRPAVPRGYTEDNPDPRYAQAHPVEDHPPAEHPAEVHPAEVHPAGGDG